MFILMIWFLMIWIVGETLWNGTVTRLTLHQTVYIIYFIFTFFLAGLPLFPWKSTVSYLTSRSALALRYNLVLSTLDRPNLCVCGKTNTVNHSLTCTRGGYVLLRHDSLKRTTAELLEKTCKDVVIEPTLIKVTTEQLRSGTKKEDGARLVWIFKNR